MDHAPVQTPAATGPTSVATTGTTGATAPTGTWTFQRGDHVELADATLATLETTAVTFDDGSFWRYEPARGLWLPVASEMVHTTVATFAGSPVLAGQGVRPLKVSHGAIVGATEIMRSELVSRPGRRVFADAPMGIAFANGFVQVVGGMIVVHQHSPDQLVRHAHPFAYAGVAPHPLFDQMLLDIFADTDPMDRAARIDLLQEFIGISVIGEATKYQRVLVLHGDGGNGKSQVVEIARAIVPGNGAVSVPPQLWAERFQIARLVGAVANFVDEIPERDITGGELFKSVVSGEPVHTERKHQDPFEFRPRAGHIFNANTLPGTVDQSHGFWRRLLVCSFTWDMEKAPCHRPNAAASVIAAELPAIVAWAIEGAARVQRNGGFTVPASSTALMETWRTDADPVRRFVQTMLTSDPTAAASSTAMYGAYRDWADRNGFSEMSSTEVLQEAGVGRSPLDPQEQGQRLRRLEGPERLEVGAVKGGGRSEGKPGLPFTGIA